MELSPYSMSLRYHGGSCCGVKHLASFEGMDPSTMLQGVTPQRSRTDFSTSGGTYHLYPGYYTTYIPRDANKEVIPAESAVVRLCRVIDWCVANWTAQRIEVTLIPEQKAAWEEILLECGFKKVGDETKNSNTSRLITTYWLVYNQRSKDLKLPKLMDTVAPKYGYEKPPEKPKPKEVPFMTVDRLSA